MPKEVKDIKGTIKRIVTPPVSKTFVAKKGPNKGKPFTIWSIGIQMDNGDWHNIKAADEEKALEYLKCQKFQRDYKEGDEVKIYIEAEDAAGQYWRITSIVPWGPTDDVPVEEVKDESEVLADAEKVIEAEKKEKEEITDKEVAEADEQYHIKPVGEVKPEAPKEAQKETPQKERAAVEDYKTREADKYELGMAKNNAIILMAAMITGKPIEEAKKFVKESGIYYDNLTASLFNRQKKVRQQVLGY